MIYKPKKKEKKHADLPNSKLSASIKFSKGSLSQAKFHPPKSPVERISNQKSTFISSTTMKSGYQNIFWRSIEFDLGT